MRASGSPEASTVARVIASVQRNLTLGNCEPGPELADRVGVEVLSSQRVACRVVVAPADPRRPPPRPEPGAGDRLPAMGTLEATHTVEIEAPLERVYEVAADIANCDKWTPSVLRSM